MILPRVLRPDPVFHQTREGREHIDGRIYCLLMQGSLQHNLPFRDIAGQIRNRMRDIVVGHRQNRDLGHGAFRALHDAGTLVQGGKLAVEISRIPFPARNLPL